MKTQMNYKALLAIATIQLAINLTPLLSIAAKGGVGDGGANSHNGQLLDSYIAGNSQRLTFNEVLAQNPVAKNFIDHAASKLSGFKRYTTSDKSWLFINGTISENDFPECLNSSAVKADKKIVACQWNKSFIIIDKKWFDSKSESTRAGLIMHEIYVGLAQKHGLYSNIETKRMIELEIQLFNGNIFKNNNRNFDVSFVDLAKFMLLLKANNIANVEFLNKVNDERSKFYSAITSVCNENLDKLDKNTVQSLEKYNHQISNTPVYDFEKELGKYVSIEFESTILRTLRMRMRFAKTNIAASISVVTRPDIGSYFENAVVDLKNDCKKYQSQEINLDEVP